MPDDSPQPLPPLLSRDLRFDGTGASDAPAVAQLALPGVDPPPARTPRRRPRTSVERPPAQSADDPLLASLARRLASHGRARKGQLAYLYQMRAMLTIAARLTGRAMTCADLVRDEGLLGRVLVDDVAPTLGTRVSRWTLAQRRSALRDFATLMRPELLALLGEEPHDRLDRALRAVAVRVGAGYRLTGGQPRRRGGRAPTEGQIRDVLEAVGRVPGYVGVRNCAFFTILAETGARVNALRLLDGEDCVEMPNGLLRIFLHEKGKAEPREVELGRATAEVLRAYAEAFNYLAATRRWGVRVHLGKPGAVWRNSPRGCWSYRAILDTLRAGCSVAEVPPFAPHALRRAFATDAAIVVPRHTVAQAGGWQGLERLDDHYVQPRAAAIRAKLDRRQRPEDAGTSGVVEHEAARPL
ncbi:MAG: site-specific integrase [Chloroflexota bacterium]|nr:site-specific integrase [Chloroflexota bacterium]